jgi:translation initiation factor 1
MVARIVYSTAAGRICPECGRPAAECVCRKRAAAAAARAGDGVVRVRREVAGRAGKTVTAIHGVPLADAALRDLASEIKRRCGTGGSVKDGVIEIQGDFRDVVIALLDEKGFTVKRAGG